MITIKHLTFITIILSSILPGCNDDNYPKRKFSQGDIVRTKAGGYEGQVIENLVIDRCPYTGYRVRVAAPSVVKENCNLFGLQCDIKNHAISIENMCEFEIEKTGS